MFAQKQKLRCSTACCFPRSLAAALAAQLVLTYCQTRLCDPILSFKKSNIVRLQKHYFVIRIVFIYDKRPFTYSRAWCPSFLGAISLFYVLQYLAIHPQNWHSLLKRELLEQRRKWVLAGGWNSSGVTHGDGVGGAWPPPHQPPISGFHIFGNYM